ncbi:protein kinase subdomain-containing protein PKL [Coprinopsis cinerea AmutBmut pab1-1]|nr:protein kinase subdomain-containing protein PKL [Coprinopsis cinerea AmutBmut pab1-1]
MRVRIDRPLPAIRKLKYWSTTQMSAANSFPTYRAQFQMPRSARFPDPYAGPVGGPELFKSGDASRYGYHTPEYEHVDEDPRNWPYSLPGERPNPRYGNKGNPPIKDGMEALSPWSTADQGPDGTEKWGRWPEPAKP